MSDLEALTQRVLAFRDERDWAQFHNPKDLAISLALESHEVMELFQWKGPDELESVCRERREDLADELADVLAYTLLLAHGTGIDLQEALLAKLEKNALKYPVEKARGSNRKYTEL
nr:nucleotide pyrophosphohydrolase [uncultured Holophaga sp.]